MSDKLNNFLAKSGLLPTKNVATPKKSESAPKNHVSAPKPVHKPGEKSDASRSSQQKRRRPQHPGRGNVSQESVRRPAPKPASNPVGNGGKPFDPRIKLLDGAHVLDQKKIPRNLKGQIRVMPLGGLEQVGQNMMMIEWGDDIIVIDTGIEFPSAEHLGVDVLVPDISYLRENRKKIRGVVYTHGHLDHIGGAPYLIPQMGFPQMFATKLTKELLFAGGREFDELVKKYKIREIDAKSKIKLGKFEIEFFHVNHSIPDAVGVVVNTPFGSIVHTGDFKIDHDPSDDMPADLRRIQQIGDRGVLLAMVDSTNALRGGHTMSEQVIEEELAKIIRESNNRVIMATFASNIGRVAKVVEAAEKDGRTVFLSGRSMERNIAIARKLGYLKCKEKTLRRMSKAAEQMDPSKVLVMSTGSQGEEFAALTRMAAGTHKDIKIRPSDTVVFSSSPIPGNELAIVSVWNNLVDRGVKIINDKNLDTHVSGHGHAEEVKQMTSLLRPKYIAPIHGELFMRHGHRDMIVEDLKFPAERSFIMKNGRGVVIEKEGVRLVDEKKAFPSNTVLIEMGAAIGDHVLADRTLMANGGAIIVTIQQHDGKIKDFTIRSRGFRYQGMKHEIFVQLEKEMRTTFDRNFDPSRPAKTLEAVIRKSAEKFLWQTYKKDSLVEIVVQ